VTGADWVDVIDEPHHVEAFGNDHVRVFEVCIAPGAATQYHRHTIDTVYVLTAGGRLRSDEPVVQPSRTRVGNSVPVPRKLGWLAGRALVGGWLTMPTGTLLMQYHTGYPLVHRVVAAERNRAAIRMIGIELRRAAGSGPPPSGLPGKLEYADTNARTHRVAVAPHESCELGPVGAGAVLVVLAGEAALNAAGNKVGQGSAAWIAAGRTTVHNAGTTTLDCFVIAPT
jgi:hypothetical protein